MDRAGFQIPAFSDFRTMEEMPSLQPCEDALVSVRAEGKVQP